MKDFLVYAASKYYEGCPIISDAEFDRLAELYNFNDVGARVDTTRAIKHAYRMYSLQKCYVGEKQVILPGEVVETPKLDGAAISILYLGGQLTLALTRGDGIAGLDITDKVRELVPNQISLYQGMPDIYQITGEVVAKKSVPNARNYAAGALNLKSVEEFKSRELYFVAYGLHPSMNSTFTADMSYLKENKFNTVLGSDWNEFPQDGRVFRVNSNDKFNELGFTSKHPKGAYALKERQEGVITTLEDIIWQVGRTGVVSPVAILKPVKVGDAEVSRATLHNMKYINDLGLELGCEVEIIRSGEIIPRVVRRV